MSEPVADPLRYDLGGLTGALSAGGAAGSSAESSADSSAGSSADPKAADALAARGGDRKAFVRLIESTGRLVLASIALDVRDAHLADDLTQETFLRAWRSIASLADAAKFNAWLLAIAASVCVDHHRAANRHKRAGDLRAVELTDQAEQRDKSPGPAEAAERSERRDRLIDALNTLPPLQRDVLAMRYLAGADYATIARQLSLSDGALRGHLHRGLAALRERLKEI